MEDDEDVRYVHLPREVFFGYPIDPETGNVPRDYNEWCIACGKPMPCPALQEAERKGEGW